MIRAFIFCLLFLSVRLVYSQKENHLTIPGSEKVNYGNKTTGIPSYIKLSDKVKMEGLNSWMDKVFKLNKDHKVKVIKIEKDELGFTHHKFQQYYKDFPVEGAVYIVHEKDNLIHSLNGMIQDQFTIDATASLSETQALVHALNYIKGEKYIWEDNNEESHLRSISKDSAATYYPKGALVIITNRLGKGSYRLAYKFDIYSIRPLRRTYVYVDANNGAIININERIHHHDLTKKDLHHENEINEIEHTNTNATGTASTKYSGTQTITTDYTGTIYRLRETGRGNGIQTLNMNRDVSYSSATDFTDSDNIWNATANYDNAAYDAHWGAEKTYDYYLNTHSRNSFDGVGGIMYNYVHYDISYDNAYWDGSRMTYGDGSNTVGGFTALSAIDVVGHELTHGVTEYSAALTYSDESGALNEAFSDMMGTTIEYYAKPATANFLIGEQISYGGGAIRNMANPNQYNQPDTYLGNMWDFSQEVHTNSGVGNFWYYLLCQGQSGTNDNGSVYNVSGIGMTKAAKIVYRTLTTYLTPDVTYADARFYSIQAAMDLYGPCTPEIQAVTNAWYAVGVGSAYVAGVSAEFSANSTSFCSIPATVNFNNLSQNANVFSWNFGDGTAASTAASPAHTYTAYGTYSVTLTATGGTCGTNNIIKTGYIVVSNLTSCPVTIPVSGTGATQTKCSGKLYDSGGTNNYEDLTNGTITIAPTGASKVTLTFSSFNFEQDYDYLYIYDGPSTSSPLIGAYTGATLPEGGTISSSSGSITLNQFSDTYVNESGFDCNWSCTVPTSSPLAAFTATPLSSCDGIVNFTDLSSNGPTLWNWTFGDGTTSTQQNPVKTYTASGTYTITLGSCNSIGCSSTLTKTSYVTVTLGSCINLPQSGTGVTQTGCSGRIFDSGGYGDYQNGTNGSMTISPPGATKITLSFSSFNFESGYDYLYIYDGPSISSPLIGQYSGNNFPGGGTITSTGGSITLRQITDGTISMAGFVCDWSCATSNSKPSIAFTSNISSTCDGVITFTDQSTNTPTSWLWDFGDGTSSVSKNPTKIYNANGTYNVKLKSCNSFGCDSIIKSNFITVNLVSCVNMPSTGTGTTQTACSGMIRDSGGEGNYQSNTDGFITITIPPGSTIALTFPSFNMEDYFDYLIIYDGPSTSSQIIAEITGDSINSFIIYSSGNSVTLEQFSDASSEYSGFVCNWLCYAQTGIKTSASDRNEIILFPNPASQQVDVLYNYSGTKQLDIILYDLLGNVVHKENGAYTNKYQNKLDVSSFTSGIYLLKISDEEGSVYKKLTITK
jgi:Zn-dependent metalloprotease